MIKISVVLLLYNASEENIRASIMSFAKQHIGDECELIIADDGSKVDPQKIVIDLVQKCHIKNYQWIRNEKNQGIVRNFLAAVKTAKGKYIKGLGQGDMLHNDRALEQCWLFMERNSARFAFADLVPVKKNACGIYEKAKFALYPFDLSCYKEKNLEKITHNMFACFDIIAGIAMIFEKNYVLHLLEKTLPSGFVYCEDLIQFTAVLEKEMIYYAAFPVVLYEYEAGMGSNPSGNRRIVKDTISVLDWVEKQLPHNKKYIITQLWLWKIKEAEHGSILNWLKKMAVFLCSPKLFLWKLKKAMAGTYISPYDLGFLEDSSFWEEIK